MIKIVAESGSTKTDWVVLSDGIKILSASTRGFNPNYFPASVLDDVVSEIALKTRGNRVSEIHYFGSGCTREESKTIVSKVLSNHFRGTKIEVHNDLYGAALALFGDGNGIAAILGTGSGSCLFENRKILHQVPSLGFLLDDEGSGFHLGKLVVNAYFKKQMPDHLNHKFSSEINSDPAGFVGKIYADPKPNSTLASFVPFIDQHKHEPFIQEILKKAFRAFFNENIFCYPNFRRYTLGFCGSVAFLFNDTLREVSAGYGLEISKIVKNPIDDLVSFISHKT